jgi:hypothetical protein
MDLNFLHQMDVATLKLERARRDLEASKSAFEAAKLEHEAVLAKSEEAGVNRSKIRKLSEERVQALFDSGLVEAGAVAAPVVREAKPKKPKREKQEAELISDTPVDPAQELHS